jgi:putative oxidoreductase
VGGFSLALGILPKYSVVCLLTFLVPATLVGHAFWLAADAQVLQIQVINFFKNVSIASGLLFIASIENQPGLKSSVRFSSAPSKRTASV